MTLSPSLKVTQHIICFPSYSCFWSLWSTDKQQTRSWCLAHLKICLLQHTLQLRHLGSGKKKTLQTGSPREGEWSNLGSSPNFSACCSLIQLTSRCCQHPSELTIAFRGPGLCLSSVTHRCWYLWSPHNTFKLGHGVQAINNLAQTNAIISARKKR